MKYFAGDTVKFKLKSGELLEGDVLFIESNLHEDILYINGSDRWAYRVPEKRILRHVSGNTGVNMRGRLDIIIDILEIAKKGATKTGIVYGANLNFIVAEKYLGLLMKNGFVENRQDKYVATERGKIILEKAKEIARELK